jgi:hypothetical protein
MGTHHGSTERNFIVTSPSRKDRLRPLELLVLSGIVAIFTGVVVTASTRDLALGAIFLGVGFILTLMTLAMLALSVKVDDAEQTDLDEQNHTDPPQRPSAH